MSVDCAHMEEDWDLFALGSLDEAAQQKMASHLQSGCQQCQRRYMEAQTGVVSIASFVPTHQPSARVERDLMKRIRQEERMAATGPGIAPAWLRWSLAPWALAAACLVLAGWFFWQQRRLGTELTTARNDIQTLRRAVTSTPAPASQSAIAERLSAENPPAVRVPNPQLNPAQGARFTSADTAALKQKLTEMETEIANLQKENSSLATARAEAEQRGVQLQSEMSAAETRTEDLARKLEAAQTSSTAANQAEIAALNNQLSESRAEVQRLGQVKIRNAQIESLLQSGSIQQVDLRAVDPSAGKAYARVLYSPQGGLLLVATSLPKLDHEKCYQLWLIRKGAPAILSGGLLQTSDDGRGFLFAPPTNDLAQLTGLAITDEPKGGSVSARGHKLLFGAQ
ncbi:MAG: anti-sigma factor [Terriglobales bacterium]